GGSGTARGVVVCLGCSCASGSIGTRSATASIAAAASAVTPARTMRRTRAPRPSGSEAVDIDDCLGECLRRFLGEIVADSARDDPMLILAGELPRIGSSVGVRRAVGVAFERDGGHPDGRGQGQALFQIVIP